MSNVSEELRHRITWFRDEQSRFNLQMEERIRQLESENVSLRDRIGVLTRILIARQIASAEEIATALAEASRPAAPPPTSPIDQPPESTPETTE